MIAQLIAAENSGVETGAENPPLAQGSLREDPGLGGAGSKPITGNISSFLGSYIRARVSNAWC